MKKLKFLLLGCLAALTQWAVAADWASDTLKTRHGKELVITFVKHGSIVFSFEGKSIQIDPVSMFGDYSRMPKADVILVTHEHPDHFDPKTINLLEKKETRIITNRNCREKLGKGTAMKNGDVNTSIPYMRIEAVPAYNTTPGREIYHPKGRDNGFVLTFDGLRIYVAGDTEDIPEMKRLHSIDVAFLPVNQPYTMTTTQAVRAAKVIRPRILYPYHYGETNVEEIRKGLKGSRTEVRIRQLQ